MSNDDVYQTKSGAWKYRLGHGTFGSFDSEQAAVDARLRQIAQMRVSHRYDVPEDERPRLRLLGDIVLDHHYPWAQSESQLEALCRAGRLEAHDIDGEMWVTDEGLVAFEQSTILPAYAEHRDDLEAEEDRHE